MQGPQIALTSGATSSHSVDLPFGQVTAMRFAADLRLARHKHPRATIAVVLRGGFMGEYGREERACTHATVVVELAGEAHANNFGRTPTSVLAISVDEGALGRAASMVELPSFGRDTYAMEIARRATADLDNPDDLTPMAVESAALELIARLARSGRDEGKPGWLRRARELLEERYADPLRLSDVAAEVGVEPERLARTFRRAFGEPMASYLRRRRVHAAATMLARDNVPISRVAADVGFADQSHLTRCFARYLGTTPGRYRSDHRTS